MRDINDVNDLRERFAALPDITLPDSLRADALFEKLDAGELPASGPELKRVVVADFLRRYRAVLSYAAGFALLVLVYYGAGLDRSLTAAPQMSVAASSSTAGVAAAADTPAPADAPAAAPQMAEFSMKAQEDAENSDTGPAPRMMAAASPLVELELGGATARLEELGDAVQLSVRCADSTDRVFMQQGSYLYLGEIEGVSNRLLLATLTGAERAPQTGSDSLSEPVAATSICSYPGEGLDQYMVLTVLDVATGTALRETAAVLGSRLILQPLGEGSYVVFSDTQQDAKPIASLALGGAMIELR